MQIIPAIITLIFALLAFLHFKWAIYGIEKPELVLPIKPSHSKSKTPGAFLTALVGFGLLLFALLFANQLLNFWNLKWIYYAKAGIGILFLLRAIGDFKYIGFFKSIKDTPFARMDTKYYAPLCLIIAGLISISVFGL